MFQTKPKQHSVLMDWITRSDREPSSALMDQAVLVRTARRQSKALVRSLALEVALAEGQRRLDQCRVGEIMRIGEETVVPAGETIAEVAKHARVMAEKYPEIAPEIEEMARRVIDILSQMPPMAMAVYASRYYSIFPAQSSRRRLRDC